jgi:hypothetical protein
MAGIVFPSIANALVPLMQMDQQKEQLSLQRQDRADNLAFRKEEADYRHKHLDEQRAMRVQSHLATMDEKKRAMVQDFAKFRVQAGGAVLAAPPEQRPQAYAMYVEEAKRRNYDMSLFPQQWDPSTERRLQFDVDQSIPWADRPQAMPAPGGGAPAPGGAPGGTEIDRASGAISGIESVGQPNGGYGAIGPQTKQGRAYGKHQVMDFNVGPWTAEVLGKAMTPQEFLANPQAQDAVFKAKFGQLAQKYGPEGAARAWFAGEGGMNNPNASDVNGMTVSRYAEKFNKGYGGQPAMGTPPPSMVAQGANAAPMPNVSPQQLGAGPGTPAEMPQFAQAGGSMPPNAGGQGGGEGRNVITPPAAAPTQGQPLPTTDGGSVSSSDLLTQIQLPAGAKFVTRGGKISKNGDAYEIMYSNGTRGEVRAPPKKEQNGPLAGTGMDQQMMGWLLTKDPGSQEFAVARSYFSKARTTVDENNRPVTIQPMDLSMFPEASFGRGGQPTGPAPLPAGSTQAQIPGGGTVTLGEPLAPKGPSAKELADIRTARADAETIIGALEKFRSAAGEAGIGERGKSLIGMTTKANTAYNVAALLAKGEALFNLGVLNGPDLEVIRRTLPDPSTFKGASADKAAIDEAVGQVSDLLKARLAAKEKQIGMGQPKSADGPAGAPKVGDEQDGYLFKGGDPSQPSSWEKVR